MTYIELINNFWFLDEDWQFTCCETRLYFYLLKTANRLGWVDSWTRSDTKVSSDVGVSVNSMKNARNRLVQAGLITFRSGGNGQRDKTKYQVICDFRYQNLTPKLEPKVQPYNNKTKTKNNNNSGELFAPAPPKKASAKKKTEDPVFPELSEVKAYFEGKLPDWETHAEKFFFHFDSLGWRNTNGTKIARWQSKANLWILDEQSNMMQNEQNSTNRGADSSTSSSESGKAGKLTAIEL